MWISPHLSVYWMVISWLVTIWLGEAVISPFGGIPIEIGKGGGTIPTSSIKISWYIVETFRRYRIQFYRTLLFTLMQKVTIRSRAQFLPAKIIIQNKCGRVISSFQSELPGLTNSSFQFSCLSLMPRISHAKSSNAFQIKLEQTIRARPGSGRRVLPEFSILILLRRIHSNKPLIQPRDLKTARIISHTLHKINWLLKDLKEIWGEPILI